MALSQVIITTDFHVYSGLIYLGIIVGDPDLIKQIMVKDFHIFTNRRPVKTTHPIMSKFLSSLVGEEWKRK